MTPNLPTEILVAGKCHRTACNNDAQGWWNRYTQAFYCQPCAFKINAASTCGQILRRASDD